MPVIACPDCGRDVSTLAPACPHCGRPSPGLSAGGASAAPAAPPATEETLWRGGPSWFVLIGKILWIVVSVILIPLAARFVVSRTPPDLETTSQIWKITWILLAIAVVAQLVAFVIAMARLRSTSYTLTNQRLLIERGLFSKSVSEIDLRTIDDTQFFQSFTDRLLGIGNVTLVSSDKTEPTTVLRSIANPRNVRELIRTNAYQISQRQLFTRAT